MNELILVASGAGAAEVHDLCDVAVNHRRRTSGFNGGLDDIIARQTLEQHLPDQWDAVCFVASEHAVVVASFDRTRGSEWDGLVGIPSNEQSLALSHLSRAVRHMVADGLISERDFDPAKLYADPFRSDQHGILTWSEVQALSRDLPGDNKVEFSVRGDGAHLVKISNRQCYYTIKAHWCHDRRGNTLLEMDAGPLVGISRIIFTGALTWSDWEEMSKKMAERNRMHGGAPAAA